MEIPKHIVVVWWRDACSDSEPTKDTKIGLYKKVTAGFLLNDTKESILITQEINEDGTHESWTEVPHGMIDRILRFKIERNK